MRSPIFTLLFCFFSSLSFAQVELESERDEDGNVIFYATNAASIPYAVLFNFSNLNNLTTPGGSTPLVVANPGRTPVLRLRPSREGQATSYRYSYSYSKGNMLAKIKEDPVYLIPVADGQMVRAMQMTHIENQLQPKEYNSNYVGVSFHFETPTVIVAPRKGVISDMRMSYEAKEGEFRYDGKDNFIEIYHEDGTFTKLAVLKKDSQKVELGDEVFPGQELALSAGENYSSGTHVRMSTFKSVKKDRDKLGYDLIPVQFITEGGAIEIPKLVELEVIHPQEIIELEMSKREKKKYFADK
ncbi:M23 family metallopeptidase [Algoriphagus sediminis]|uniref:M23 family metallopeptidase n=1 Tax=Algoriphagus sediminis TaxID=3057113 RepID=A0ABT7YER2_9BACT|nr:M23 family metallopeptidase [Algoriphagus sediminis]MDN3205009.1 M23 family metallopeptidase [Algoriphagus sediminis]